MLRAPSRPLTFQMTFAVLALATACIATVGGFGLYSMMVADRDALVRQKTFIENGIREQREDVAQEQESVTFWDDAVLQAKALDHAWMAENLSEWMASYYGHDQVFVLDEHNAPIHGMVGGKQTDPGAFREIGDVVLPMARALRERMDEIANGTAPEDAKPIVEDIASVAGIPAIVSLMPIVPSSDRIDQPSGSEYLHVTIQLVDDTLIGEIGEKYQIAGAHLLSLTETADMDATVPLVNSKGTILGHIGWTRDRPGLLFMRKTAPALIACAFFALGMFWYLLRRLRRATTDIERGRSESEFLAFHDTLTDLPNRMLFEERLARAHNSADTKSPIALLYIDLDRFKHVNDTLGHAAGDDLVRQAAQRLKSAVRTSDFVARLGGDEFAIIMEKINGPRDAEKLSSLILAEMARPFALFGDHVHIGASIGVCIGPDHDGDHAELLRKADIALYEAKKRGRGRAEFFVGGMDDVLVQRRRIESDLRTALGDKAGLSLAYQPIFAPDCVTIVGCEALIRWVHPEHGAVPPSQFIAIAEDRGMMVELGEWLLETACVFAARSSVPWIAVNISPVELREAAFCDRLLDILATRKLETDRILIEITENVLLDPGGNTGRNLARLRAAGIKVALDDFGTGYSSVNYLRRYGIDKLKVDRSFVHMLGKEKTAAPIVQAIIDLAEAIEVAVTIEGIETPMQRDMVLAMGANEIQGFLLSPPVDGARLEELLAFAGRDQKRAMIAGRA